MTSKIDSTAIVDKSAQLGLDIVVGPYAIVGKNVVIGDRTEIYAHAILGSGTIIGADCEVHYGAVIGDKPQDFSYKDEETNVVIGDRCRISEYVTIHKATGIGNKTVVGNDCLLMSFVHIGHNCQLGNRVVIANLTQCAGHVEIENFATIGGMVAIPQFLRVGKLAMVAAYARLFQDIPPFMLAEGTPAEVRAINAIGVKRNDEISFEAGKIIKQAYKILYRQNLNNSQALVKIKQECLIDGKLTAEVQHLVDFIGKSKKGISRSASRMQDLLQNEESGLMETVPFFEKMKNAFTKKIND